MLKHHKDFELLQLVMQQTLSKNRMSFRHCARHQEFLLRKTLPQTLPWYSSYTIHCLEITCQDYTFRDHFYSSSEITHVNSTLIKSLDIREVFTISFSLGADIPLWRLSQHFALFLCILSGLPGFWHFLHLFKQEPDFNQGIWKEYEFCASILFPDSSSVKNTTVRIKMQPLIEIRLWDHKFHLFMLFITLSSIGGGGPKVMFLWKAKHYRL